MRRQLLEVEKILNTIIYIGSSRTIEPNQPIEWCSLEPLDVIFVEPLNNEGAE